ncbi:hypothetical protein [Pelagibacterium mangrovi]|uniref:hypothetical protein n=1 Tax=Pelagibacterium mangrovi TaxID=3119828 RepID=UPI002FCABA3C
MDINDRRNQIIREMFVRTADQNYFAARICYHLKMPIDFWWMTAQTAEKLLKAIALTHGDRVNDLSHDGTWDRACKSSGLANFDLEQPLLNGERRTAQEFVLIAEDRGSASARYNDRGYNLQEADLQHLDQMVHRIRGFCRTPIDYGFYRPKGADEPWFVASDLPLEELIIGRQGISVGTIFTGSPLPKIDDSWQDELRRHLYRGNSFFGDGQQGSSRNMMARPPLTELQAALAMSPQPQWAIELGNWLLDSVKLDKDLKDEIRSKLSL